MNLSVDELNRKLKDEYEGNGGLELFTKYVMSEALPPIEDYENIVRIIRENYHKQISVDLLIIGAYCAIYWTHSDSEMLEILNLLRPFLPDKQRAIVHYLNAYKLRLLDDDYLSNHIYQTELTASLITNVAFVNSRLMIAELLPEKEAKKYYSDAVDNVQEVFTEEELGEISQEYSLDPQSFINEFILGTHLIYDKYNEIVKKSKRL